jgi:hypothetical protein
LNEESRKELHLKKWEEAKRCPRDQPINLNPNPHKTHQDDFSEDIQNLLRRKKELFFESKSSGRVHTEASRALSTDIRGVEKRHYYQDDDGSPLEMLHSKPIKQTQDFGALVTLSTRWGGGGQQLAATNSGLRKKPVVELVAVRRRKRKGVGETCVLVEQMLNRESKPALEEVIEACWRAEKGVRLTVKERRTTVVRLPTLR